MIKAAIVGCGKMADQHALQIRKICSATLVAACDAEPIMAKQLAERFDIPAWFTDIDEMLASARPDVVHVTTPPRATCRSVKNASRPALALTLKSRSL